MGGVGQTLGDPAHAQAGAMPRDCLTGMGREDPADVMRRVVQPFREVLQRERRVEREQLACVASEPLVRPPAVRRTLHPDRLRDQRERPLLGSAVVAPGQRREQAAMLEVERRARAEARALSRQPRAVGEAGGQLDRGETVTAVAGVGDLDLQREEAGQPDAGTQTGHQGGGAKARTTRARFEFTGTAQPSEARVTIEGADAQVDHRRDGVFIVTVRGLRRGATELTVRASAPGLKPWSEAVTITRR